jgi:hypothetical protein
MNGPLFLPFLPPFGYQFRAFTKTKSASLSARQDMPATRQTLAAEEMIQTTDGHLGCFAGGDFE